MYEHMTFEVILQRLMDRVPNTVDKREGSIIYYALAPAAVELQNAYIAIDGALSETSVKTATSTYLDDIVEEKGIYRIPATNSIKKGVFNIDVPIGSRSSGGDLNYTTVEKISTGVFKLQCETAGTIGNEYIGTIIPIDYIEGLTSAEVTELLIPARNVETDDELRSRFFSTVTEAPIDGNKAQYIKWANEYLTVGKTKVFSLWNGPNTVKVSVLNSDSGLASAELIEEFQNYLDPNSEGKGNGVAPIGAIVTVTTANEVTININLQASVAEGYSDIVGLDEDIREWFKKISYVKSKVNFYEMAALILANPSVLSITSLQMNNSNADITLLDEQIPKLGLLTIQVV